MAQIVEVLPTPEALIDKALTVVVERIHWAIADHQYCTIALAGGGTPKPLYGALALQTLPWEQIHCFWGDERYVPSTHEDSNQRMAREVWLDQVPIPAQNLHPMPTGAGDPVLDAQAHQQEIQHFFNLADGAWPKFDLVLLGIGSDGHTASLFPHTPALTVTDQLVTVGNKAGEPRLTFTVPLLNQAEYVLFLVAGEGKRGPLGQILADTGDDSHYPARLIHPQGTLHWLCDQAAGADFQ
jgi:6-phosphogluconolactonase